MFESLVLIAIALALLPIVKKNFYILFVVALLMTEFFYIQVGGGIARGYHFIAVLIVLMNARLVPKLLPSRVFIALLLFVLANLCAIIFADAPGSALASFLSLAANISVAMAIALILLSGKISISTLKRIILIVTLLSIAWGFLQIVAFRLSGVSLALSHEQATQIRQGFGPGFRTEANTFAKYMVFPFLLFLPDYLEHKQIRNISLVFLVFLVGILMNLTRTSLYGMGLAFIFILLWYTHQHKLVLFTAKSIKIAIIASIGFALLAGGAINVSEYATYKANSLFNKEEILEGDSSVYRLKMMSFIIDDALENKKKMLIGNGWGQTHYYYKRRDVTAGGGDIVTILGYAGLVGVMTYLYYMLSSFYVVWKIASQNHDIETAKFAEGLMFALVGIFCTSQMAGYIIAPEYWLLIGLCIFLSLDQNFKQSHLPKVRK